LLIVAPDTQKTDSVNISIDGGNTWSEVKITNTPFLITGIATEP
jgi:hypothetical protein